MSAQLPKLYSAEYNAEYHLGNCALTQFLKLYSALNIPIVYKKGDGLFIKSGIGESAGL